MAEGALHKASAACTLLPVEQEPIITEGGWVRIADSNNFPAMSVNNPHSNHQSPSHFLLQVFIHIVEIRMARFDTVPDYVRLRWVGGEQQIWARPYFRSKLIRTNRRIVSVGEQNCHFEDQ
jgi:hypothetical protein